MKVSKFKSCLEVRLFHSDTRHFLFPRAQRKQKRESSFSYQQIWSNIRRIIGPEVLSSTPFVTTEKMINLLKDSFTLKTVTNLIDSTNNTKSAEELIASASRFISDASLFDLSNFLRIIARKKIAINSDFSYQIATKLHDLTLSAQDAIVISRYHTLGYQLDLSLILVLILRILPSAHLIETRDLCHTLYIMTLPPLKFHAISHKWLPYLLDILAAKHRSWTNSFSEMNQVISIVARAVSMCTAQTSNHSLKSILSISCDCIKAWLKAIESIDFDKQLDSPEEDFERSKKIRESIFFLSACSYVRYFGILMPYSGLKSISDVVVRAILRENSRMIIAGKTVQDSALIDPRMMFRIAENIIQDANLLSKLILALSHNANPFVVQKMRQLFLSQHQNRNLSADESESGLRHAMNIAMRILRSLNMINDASSHEEDYDFLWDIIYGAICRKQSLEILSIAASCLWNDDYIRDDCKDISQEVRPAAPRGHMESTIAMSLYMIISSYAFKDTEIENPSVLDMVCSVVQYLKTNFLLQSNLAKGSPSLISDDGLKRIDTYVDDFRCEMELLIQRIFVSVHDLQTIFRMVSVCPYLLEDHAVDRHLLSELDAKRKNLPGGFPAKFCTFVLGYPRITIAKWPLAVIVSLVDMLQFYYTHLNHVDLGEIYVVVQTVGKIIETSTQRTGRTPDPLNTSSADVELPIKLQNAINGLCFVLCGHLFAVINQTNLLKRRITYNHDAEASLRVQSIINFFQSTSIKLPKSMRHDLDVLLDTVISQHF